MWLISTVESVSAPPFCDGILYDWMTTGGVTANSVPGAERDSAMLNAMPQKGAKPTARFPKSARLLRHADFERVYKEGRRHFSALMTVFYLPRVEHVERALPSTGSEPALSNANGAGSAAFPAQFFPAPGRENGLTQSHVAKPPDYSHPHHVPRQRLKSRRAGERALRYFSPEPGQRGSALHPGVWPGDPAPDTGGARESRVPYPVTYQLP